MKTLSELAKEVYQAKNSPDLIADLHIEVATIYASMTDEYKDLKIHKAIFWNDKGEYSDKAMEMRWIQTEDGKKELKIKYILDGLEKLIGAIKTASVKNAIEAKNLV